MENTTSFDLNRAIQQWRENLGQSPAFRSENLNELESHLSDSIATLQTRGLSAEEAFLIASRRIGKGGSLEMEFAKVNRRIVWLDRTLWMLIGVQIWGLVSGLIGSVARNALTLGWRSPYNKESALTFPITLFALAQVLVIAASLIFCWWLVVRKGERLGARLTPLLKRRSTLVATCAGLCLLSLIVYSLSSGMQMVLIRSKFVGLEALNTASLYFSYSRLIVWPIQVVTMIILTLALARKRLRVSQA
jgi:hypothetical protein